jgi:stearoyl-CoA desaturase (delta-9 desaturase)
MRPGVFRVDGMAADPCAGRVRWAPAKSLWHLALGSTALIGAPLTFSVDALLVFLGLTYFTLLLGHSVGMHRKRIRPTATILPRDVERRQGLSRGLG